LTPNFFDVFTRIPTPWSTASTAASDSSRCDFS
jgi:hypothetical protein